MHMLDSTEDIRIEQAIRYLLKYENHFTLSQFSGGVDVFSACRLTDESLRKLGTGATLTGAMLSAVETVRSRRSSREVSSGD